MRMAKVNTALHFEWRKIYLQLFLIFIIERGTESTAQMEVVSNREKLFLIATVLMRMMSRYRTLNIQMRTLIYGCNKLRSI